MTSAMAKTPLGSEFDAFLFALLGEDQNGLPLSVISLLARMNLDPWQEAGDLAALPADAAARRLAGSLDTLTDPRLRQANTMTRVLSLLALLPRAAPATIGRPVAAGAAAAAPDHRARIGAVIVIMSAIVLLGSQILAAHRSGPTQPAPVHASPALTTPSAAQPANQPQR